MKRLVAVFASLVFAVALQAQTAKVIQLSPEDAAKAKQLYDAKQEAEKAYKDFQTGIANHYVSDEKEHANSISGSLVTCGAFDSVTGVLKAEPCPETAKPTPPTPVKKYYVLREGWTDGFDFSGDFKFIVPVPEPTYKSTPYCYGALTVTN